jgi:hypothetical protein
MVLISFELIGITIYNLMYLPSFLCNVNKHSFFINLLFLIFFKL